MTINNIVSTIAYLANLIPDWNSLDSVRRAHSRFELASIVFFGLLALAEAIAHKLDEGRARHRMDTIGIVFFVIAVLCEGMAYPYGQRNDELSEDVITSLDQKATHAKDSAEKAETAAIRAGAVGDAVMSRAEMLEQEDKRLNADLAMTGSRAELFKSPEVTQNLLKAARSLAGQKVDVRFPAGFSNSEPENTAALLASVLRAGGMRVSGPMISRQDAVTGIFVYITWKASTTTREHALRLANALLAVPLLVRSTRYEATVNNRVITIPKPEPLGVMFDTYLKREPQSFPEGKEPLPFDDETIVVQVCPHP